MSNDKTRHKACWACAEPLSPNQQLCKECDQWQNWRQYFSLSSTILSLVIALIAVTGTLGPKIVEMFQGEELKLSFAASFSENHLKLSIANSGSVLVLPANDVGCLSPEEVNYRGLLEDIKFLRIGQTESLEFRFPESLPKRGLLTCTTYFAVESRYLATLNFKDRILSSWELKSID